MRARRRRINRRSLWFVLAGFLVILFDIAIINWTLTLPQGLGSPVWTGIFTLGVVLIVFSSSFARITPPALSRVHADHIEKWKESGDLVTMVDNLSQDETSTLLEFSRKHFGEYVARAGTTPKGKTWTVKLWRVGYQILPARLEEGRPLFKVILYRRDLASQKGIRRPWRTIYREDTALQLVKPGPLIELPNWIAD
jgi:hypothetical protein